MAHIELRNVSLTYSVFHAAARSVKTAVKSLATGGLVTQVGRGRVEVEALHKIDLEARDGERIALLGHNGAGKTTLLKVLAGIYKPQAGTIRRRGKTVTIINPAIGLNPSETGSENIVTIGLLSGLSLPEIQERAPDIEAFTELGEFLDLPVSSYSAGMRTRLAFAVATSLNPEILILDENLGTGDARFIARAKERMRDMMDRSSILVLASHSLPTLNQLCNRGILLERGRIIAEGDMADVIAAYRERQAAKS